MDPPLFRVVLLWVHGRGNRPVDAVSRQRALFGCQRGQPLTHVARASIAALLPRSKPSFFTVRRFFSFGFDVTTPSIGSFVTTDVGHTRSAHVPVRLAASDCRNRTAPATKCRLAALSQQCPVTIALAKALTALGIEASCDSLLPLTLYLTRWTSGAGCRDATQSAGEGRHQLARRLVFNAKRSGLLPFRPGITKRS